MAYYEANRILISPEDKSMEKLASRFLACFYKPSIDFDVDGSCDYAPGIVPSVEELYALAFKLFGPSTVIQYEEKEQSSVDYFYKYTVMYRSNKEYVDQTTEYCYGNGTIFDDVPYFGDMDEIEEAGTTTTGPFPYEPIALTEELENYVREKLEAEDEELLTFLEEL